jgi:hypothetical protein
MKYILQEAYKNVKQTVGIDPTKPGRFREILVNQKAWDTYKRSLSESIKNTEDRRSFEILAENTRVNMLENSMYQINPYETLTLPIIRVFYPKLVAKEAVTVTPMDKPEVIKPYISSSFTPYGGSAVPAPSVTTDISGGPSVGVESTATMTVPSSTNVLSVADLVGKAHLERDFLITKAIDSTGNEKNVNIVPDVEGHFSASVTLPSGTDVIVGHVNYLTGVVNISSTTGIVVSVVYSVTMSLEENKVNPSVTLNIDKIRLYAKDRQISSNWSINMEQDMRALFDLSVQAEIVNLLGQQIALDIDREIIAALISANTRLNTAAHTATFDKTPPEGYAWGQKYWFENILPTLNALSATVYNDTNMGSANTIICNPLDAAIFESLNGFAYTGTSVDNGDLGYRTATVSGGKWKILTSSEVTQGTMILVYVPVEAIKAVYFYAPYVPAILHPYPLGATPSLTVLSRYATALVRSAGIATLNIIES